MAGIETWLEYAVHHTLQGNCQDFMLGAEQGGQQRV